MKKDGKQLIIIGASEFAEIAYEYFTYDSPYTVIAFSIEREYISRTELFNLPVVPLEELEKKYPPSDYSVFVATTYTQLNRLRARFYHFVKEKGYSVASYVSSHAFVWRNVEIGENCFVFENNVLQYHVKLGNNVILWSGNHVGHRTQIEDNCFISSHVVISGYCTIGKNSFLGVNSCLNDHIIIGQDCVIGSGSVVVKNTEAGMVYVGNPAKPGSKSSFEAFGVKDE
jgi:sugar O-acyltransferase, sialic acid O-acetyltransferase NeuD family